MEPINQQSYCVSTRPIGIWKPSQLLYWIGGGGVEVEEGGRGGKAGGKRVGRTNTRVNCWLSSRIKIALHLQLSSIVWLRQCISLSPSLSPVRELAI